MYTNRNFKTKKAFKEAILAGEKVTVYQPAGIGETPTDGIVFCEGPHYPQPHTWYAEVTLANGYVVKVK